MRLTLNTRKVGRRRVGNGMRMILSIGHWRNNVVGNLHRIIRTIGRSGGCICKSGENGRRRKGNSFQFSVFSGESGLQSPPTRGFPPTKEQIVLESGLQSPPTRGFPPTKEQIVLESGLQSPPTRGFPPTKEQIVFESGLQDFCPTIGFPPTRADSSIRIGLTTLPQEGSLLPKSS